MFQYEHKNINKWLNNDIKLHCIMKHFNMTQWRVLCPHYHLLKTTTITGDIRELSSPRAVQSARCPVRELSSPLLDQSARCPVRELALRKLAYLWVVQLPFTPVPGARCQYQVFHAMLNASTGCSKNVVLSNNNDSQFTATIQDNLC